MAMVECQHFSGYKPCGLSKDCSSNCIHFKAHPKQILVIHLGALGAVLRSTSLLEPIRRKYPNCSITWVTERPADQLLKNLKQVDRVLTLDTSHLVALASLQFDVAFCIDKSLAATGLERFVRAKSWLGFRSNTQGKILPATEAARELWNIGLDDDTKFFVNRKPETQLVTEALELPYTRSPYEVVFSEPERVELKRREVHYRRGTLPTIGINTGCSGVIAYKKLSVPSTRDLIRKIQNKIPAQIVLLGGPEDEARNREIAEGLHVISSPTRNGLRDGLISMATCDVVFSGDSLGLHMAIGLKIPTVAWFGPTCPQEIDLFENGIKVLAKVPCSPCWKRSCQRNPMCYDRVDLDEVTEAVEKLLCKSSRFLSSKQPSSEISFSASP